MLQKLERSIGHHFNDALLFQTALTHRSHSTPHNERLEYLGDSVLNAVVARLLFERFPELPEGDLSRLRANLVRQESLHRLADQLMLGQFSTSRRRRAQKRWSNPPIDPRRCNGSTIWSDLARCWV